MNNQNDLSSTSNAFFHAKFMQEFKSKILESANENDKETETETTYCKISYHQEDQDDISNNNSSMYKTFNDPFKFKIRKMPNIRCKESLNLMYEEAFFLVFALDCLTILENNNKKMMSIKDLWQYFSSIDAKYPFKYACYHYLRSKGWIIKCGLKYGSDFLVYYEGPDRYHASYSVRVVPQDLNHHQNKREQEEFSQFSALTRINETVCKVYRFNFYI